MRYLSWHSIITSASNKVVKYHTDMKLYAATFAWTMNQGTTEALRGAEESDRRSLHQRVGAKVGTDWGNDEDSGQDKLSKTPGHTIVNLSDTQLKAGARPPSR